MSLISPNPPSGPWPIVTRYSDGELELSFDAPLTTACRVDWLRARDWIANTYGAKFSNPIADPVTQFWSVEVQVRHTSRVAAARFGSSDFPDDLFLCVRDAASEWLIQDAAARLRAERPDLGQRTQMNREEFNRWLNSLHKPVW